MDTKAMAKSKRAHTLHHSKKKMMMMGDKKATTVGKGKQVREKPEIKLERSLPSNWDRYGYEEDDEESTSLLPTEFVLPKSKGADYAHLISEATPQSQPNYSSHVFRAHVFDDFTQDFGPVLSEKGQSILSWIADNNFEVEDKASTNIEAPFLSLNLNAISEQLSKAKLSKRLFIEPDLLPPELLDDELQSYAEDKGEPKACTSAVEIDSGPSSLGYNQEKSKILQQYHKPISSAQGVNPIEEIKDEIVLQSQQTDRIPSSNLTSVEAELDMLLNSFAETNIVDSSPVQIPSIDNLLEQTSDLTKMDRRGLSHGSVNTSTDDISSKSKLLDDFDSWLDTI